MRMPKKTSTKQLPLPSIPEAGQQRYFVACTRLGIYTSMGADNIHHVSNKAIKLFGRYWSMLCSEFQSHDLHDYNFVPVKEFNKLLKGLPQ